MKGERKGQGKEGPAFRLLAGAVVRLLAQKAECSSSYRVSANPADKRRRKKITGFASCSSSFSSLGQAKPVTLFSLRFTRSLVLFSSRLPAFFTWPSTKIPPTSVIN